MKTAELKGAALDWAVAKCEGLQPIMLGSRLHVFLPHKTLKTYTEPRNYSSSWKDGGPIIERMGIELNHNVVSPILWAAWIKTWNINYAKTKGMTGSTPLIAAMRCYVTSKLGDEVEIPEELL